MTVRQVKPDVLLGLSAVGGLFSKEVLEALKGSTSTRPAIFAMSNPTKNAECTPDEAFSIVSDNVIFGSGSPFSNVELDREGAWEADLNILPKYKFQTSKDEHRVDLAAGAMVPIETSSGYMPSERTLSPDDAVNDLCVLYFGFYILPPKNVISRSPNSKKSSAKEGSVPDRPYSIKPYSLSSPISLQLKKIEE
ncbi:hypothetical protein OROMI_018370 [Orobanche minor]